MTIKIVKGNIMEQDVDYIVNAANSHLRHGGGIARAIADAAAPWGSAEWRNHPAEYNAKVAQWEEDHLNAPLIATGDAYVTSAGVLPYKGVVHAVGPVWGGGGFHEGELLHSAYRMAIVRAQEHSGKNDVSIAFPAISCGIFGYPIDRAATLAISAVEMSNPKGLNVFTLFGDDEYETYIAEAEACGLEYLR